MRHPTDFGASSYLLANHVAVLDEVIAARQKDQWEVTDTEPL